MTISLYMVHHIPRAITEGLRMRGVDVLTDYEDGANGMLDPDLLDRATNLGRVLFTQDNDLLTEATRRQKAGLFFGGVIFVRQRHIGIGDCIRCLELIAKACQPGELHNRVQYLPI